MLGQITPSPPAPSLIDLISSYRSIAVRFGEVKPRYSSNPRQSDVIAAVSHYLLLNWCFQIQNTHQCPLEVSFVHVPLG